MRPNWKAEKLAIEGGRPAAKEFIVFGRPSLGNEEIREVSKVIRTNWIGTGPKTEEFEKMFSATVGSRHAVAVNSCTSALHLSLIAAGIKPGDEVITTPMSFVATSNVILHAGGKPVFVDIDPQTLNINPDGIERKITRKTKAIVPVHFGGLPCDMEKIRRIAKKFKLTVIEDAAHALGARYGGQEIGKSPGGLVCFSFYPNKTITTGEGGMVTTDREDWDETIRVWRLHGLDRDAWKRYRSGGLLLSYGVVPGFKNNMTDLQSAMGLCQMKKLEGFMKTREKYAKMFDEAFREFPEIELQPRPVPSKEERHGLHLYILLLRLDRLTVDRDSIVRALRAENIGAAIHYLAIHLHPHYKKLGHKAGQYPEAESVSNRILSLPLSPAMTPAEVEAVIHGVRKVIRRYRK
jgi:dTDP-4-amino-4,6-dideoxygalactose transaminase